jgi:hypothetical protein
LSEAPGGAGFEGSGTSGDEFGESGGLTASSSSGASTGGPSTGSTATATASSTDSESWSDTVGTDDETDAWSDTATSETDSWSDTVTTEDESDTWSDTGETTWGTDTAGDGDGDLTCPPYWIVQSGSSQPDSAYRVATNAAGEVFISGSTNLALPGLIPNGRTDFFINKYNSDGAPLWSRQYGSPEDENGRDFALSASGELIVVGTTDGSFGGNGNAGGYDAFVSKLSPSGDLIWTRFLGSSGYDAAYGVALGSDASIYVTGESDGILADGGSPGTRHIFVARFGSDGQLVWVRQPKETEGDGGQGIALDPFDRIFVTGEIYDGPADQTSSSSRFFVRSYAADGTPGWNESIDVGGIVRGYGIAASSASELYVVGSTSTSLPGEQLFGSGDAFVVKYEANGSLEWARHIGTPEVDYATGVSVAPDGAVYVSGTTLGSLPNNQSNGLGDIFVTKLTPFGDTIWNQQLGTSSLDRGWSVTVHDDGGVYIGGATEGLLAGDVLAGGWDIFAAELCEL